MRLVAFTSYAVPLYVAALLLLLGLLIMVRGQWRRASAWLLALVLPLLALHLSWVADQFVDEYDPESDGSQRLTVMAVNLLVGRADPIRVVRLAAERDADVLVASEVTPSALQALHRAGIEKRFPHQAGRPEAGVSGTMVFSTTGISDVTALDTQLGGFVMKVKAPGGKVNLIAAHPHPPTGNARHWRSDHAAVRGAAAAAEGRTVIAGDLNATLDHMPMRELDGRGFTDAVDAAGSGWQPTWPASGEVSVLGVGVPPLLPLDHVLVSDGFMVFNTEAVDIPGTDHRALIARLVLP